MSADFIIGSLGVIVALALGVLGFNVSIYPITPGDVRRIRLCKWLFGGLTIVAAGLATTQGIRNDMEKQQAEKEAKHERERTEAHLSTLRAEAKAAKDAQQSNTRSFTESFTALSQELADIKTKVRTEELQQRITTLQSELANTQKALAPPPKAVLVATFSGYEDLQRGSIKPVRIITLPATPDGNIAVPIWLVNPTEADAVEVRVNIIICRLCKYTKEPIMFRHIKSTLDQERTSDIPYIAAVSEYNVVLELTISKNVQTFDIGIKHRCKTCVLEVSTTVVKVQVKWPGAPSA